MDKKIHIKRHKGLHEALDELIADWIIHNKNKDLSKTTIIELMEWSAKQTKNPS